MARFKPVEAEELKRFLAGLYSMASQADDIAERMRKTVDKPAAVSCDDMRDVVVISRNVASFRDAVHAIFVAKVDRAEMEANLRAQLETAAHVGKLAAGLSGDEATGE